MAARAAVDGEVPSLKRRSSSRTPRHASPSPAVPAVSPVRGRRASLGSEGGSPMGQSSRHVGVTWDKARRKWRASLQLAGKRRHLGLFDDERIAAAAYDAARLEKKMPLANGTTPEERAEAARLRRRNRSGITGASPRARDGYGSSVTSSSRSTTPSATSTGKRSKFRGVVWDDDGKQWHAQMNSGGQRRHLGDFDDEMMAAAAYDAARLDSNFGTVNGSSAMQRSKAVRISAGLPDVESERAADAPAGKKWASLGTDSGARLMHARVAIDAASGAIDHASVNEAPSATSSSSGGGTSRYTGVSWSKSCRKWVAKIRSGGGNRRHLGHFVDERMAAAAYDAARVAMHMWPVNGTTPDEQARASGERVTRSAAKPVPPSPIAASRAEPRAEPPKFKVPPSRETKWGRVAATEAQVVEAANTVFGSQGEAALAGSFTMSPEQGVEFVAALGDIIARDAARDAAATANSIGSSTSSGPTGGAGYGTSDDVDLEDAERSSSDNAEDAHVKRARR